MNKDMKLMVSFNCNHCKITKEFILYFAQNNALIKDKRKRKNYVNWTEERKMKRSDSVRAKINAKENYRIISLLKK